RATPEPAAVVSPAAMSKRSDEIDPLDERAIRLPHNDEHLFTRRGDFGGASGPGQSYFGLGVVADHCRVDVAVLVDLRRAEEADVDAAGLQPIVENLGDTDHRVGGLGQGCRRRWMPATGPAWSPAFPIRTPAPALAH